jgi:hypothetical protein
MMIPEKKSLKIHLLRRNLEEQRLFAAEAGEARQVDEQIGEGAGERERRHRSYDRGRGPRVQSVREIEGHEHDRCRSDDGHRDRRIARKDRREDEADEHDEADCEPHKRR